jgi:2-oxoglutarate dehydrogenase E2 component (dihydrolipoamide succinyltransferase)
VTYLSFIFKAVVDALRAVPIVNASVDGDNIVYHKEINHRHRGRARLGADRPGGETRGREEPGRHQPRGGGPREPRARQAAEAGGSRRRHLHDHQPGRLRRALRHADHQPAAGRESSASANVEKRPVVVDDAIAIRPMAYLTLGYDHRVIDGAVADEFMSIIKKTLETWEPSAV